MVKTNVEWRLLQALPVAMWMMVAGGSAIAAEPDAKIVNPINISDSMQITPTVGMEQVRSVSQMAESNEAILISPGMLQVTSVSQLTDVKPLTGHFKHYSL